MGTNDKMIVIHIVIHMKKPIWKKKNPQASIGGNMHALTIYFTAIMNKNVC